MITQNANPLSIPKLHTKNSDQIYTGPVKHTSNAPNSACRALKIAVLSSSPTYRRNASLWSLLNPSAVTQLDDRQKLLELLDGHHIDFVLLDTEYGKPRFLEAIKRTQPASRFVFLVKEPCPSSLLNVAMRGHTFFSLPYKENPLVIVEEFLEKAFPRKESRCLLKETTIEFNTREAGFRRWKRPLFDISNYGISWLTEQGDTSEHFLPGTVIHNLRITRGKKLLATVQRALVQYLGPFGFTPQRYRVGAQFLAEQDMAASLLKEKIIHDFISLTSILKQGLQKSDMRLTHPYDKTKAYYGRGEIAQDCPGKSILLRGDWPAEWRVGTLVRGTFEYAGKGYEFLSVIEERADYGTIKLRAPSAVKGLYKRYSLRHRPSRQSAMLISFLAPFSHQPVREGPLDVSTKGFAVEINETTGPMPCGTLLYTIILHGVDDGLIRFSGLVRSVCRVYKLGKSIYRFGVEIENLSNSDLLTTTDAVVSDKIKDVKSSHGISLKELWDFFYKSQFIYPKKEEAMRPVLDKVQNTFSILIRDHASPILRSLVVCSEDSSINAHISLLHVYTQTWMTQHLASMGMRSKNRYAARNINIGIINTLSQLGNMQWLRAYFQPQKNSPDRIVGVFARGIEDGSLSNLNIYAYLTSPTNVSLGSNGPLTVRPASPADFQLIEKYFVYQGSLIEFLAEDGTQGEMNLESISHEYQNCGLTRLREVAVAELHGRVCGVAFMEFSSQGLNLSEITNRCAIHVWEEKSLALLSLAEHARCRYRQLGYPICVVMARPEFASLLTPYGFVYSRDYACWTLGRELVPAYEDYMEKLFRSRV